MRKQLVAGCKFHNLAEIHHGNAVAEILDDGQVVCDKQNGKPKVVAQVVKQVDHLCLNGHVQRRNRFVGDNQFRIENYRSRNADTLTLTAAEFVGVTSCVFRHQPDKVKHLVHLFVDVLFVLNTTNNKPFGNDFPYRHTRIKRSDGILENHLHLVHDAVVLRQTKLFLVLFVKLGKFRFVGGLYKQRFVLFAHRLHFLLRVQLVAVFVVVLRLADFFLLFGDKLCQLFPDGDDFSVALFSLRLRVKLGKFDLGFRTSLGNGFLVTADTCANALSLEVHAAARNVVKSYYGTSRSRLSATGFAYQAKHFALVHVKTDVVDGFQLLVAHLKVLFEVLYREQNFSFTHTTLPPVTFSLCGPPGCNNHVAA